MLFRTLKKRRNPLFFDFYIEVSEIFVILQNGKNGERYSPVK